jgi:hypothetical protein
VADEDVQAPQDVRPAAVAASNQIAAGTYSITTIEVKGFGMRAGVDGVDLNGGYTRKVTASAHGAPPGFYFENQDQDRSVRIIRNPVDRQWQFTKADDPTIVYAKSEFDKWDRFMPDEPMYKDVASTTDHHGISCKRTITRPSPMSYL